MISNTNNLWKTILLLSFSVLKNKKQTGLTFHIFQNKKLYNSGKLFFGIRFNIWNDYQNLKTVFSTI